MTTARTPCRVACAWGLLIRMQGLAAILFPLGLMVVALGMERLENLVMRDSTAISPDQVDSLLNDAHAADAGSVRIADVAVLPTTTAAAGGARIAS